MVANTSKLEIDNLLWWNKWKNQMSFSPMLPHSWGSRVIFASNPAPCSRSQTSPRALGRTFVFPPPPSLSPSPTPRARSPSPRSPELLGVNVGQRVRRLSSPGGEERGGGDGPEERGGTGAGTGGGEKRKERRRQAQLLQIHRELQNVEVNFHVHLLLCLSTCLLFLFFHLTHFICLYPVIQSVTKSWEIQ